MPELLIEKILEELNLQRLDCDYCDVRLEETTKTDILYRNKVIESANLRPSLGAFLRVYKKGRWSYTSTTEIQKIRSTLEQMCQDLSHFPDGPKRPYPGAPVYQERKILFASMRTDHIPLGLKRQVLETYLSTFDSSPFVKESMVVYKDQYKIKGFKSSKGTQYVYDYNECGVTFRFTLKDGPSLFQDKFMLYSSQFADLKGHQERLAKQIKESEGFLKAPEITPGNYPVVMSTPVVGVFAHESFGHKSEADFMLGDPKAREQWKLGTKVGSEVLSIVDTGDTPGTSGYCPFDDEGFPTQKTYLINKGLLAGRLHSQVTAQEFDEAPTGNGRAINFEYEPIVRMTSTYVEAGDLSFEELLSKVDLGVYIPDMHYGTGLSTFTIAPARAYYIRQGKLAEPVRVSVISGSVFETLNNVAAVSKEFDLMSSAIGGCGKGEQGPLPVSFGGPYVLVNDMVVS